MKRKMKKSLQITTKNNFRNAIWQMGNGRTNGLNEPQAFLRAYKNRSIEITLKSKGLAKKDRYYLCRLYCSDKDSENGLFNDIPIVVMKTHCTDGLRPKELKGIINNALYCSMAV